jgi:hypothetical protein
MILMKKEKIIFYLTAVVVVLLASCATVRNHPINKPFVFDNKIFLDGNLPKDEKKRLTNDLSNYWDDSLRALKLQKLFFFTTLKNPPLFDSVNISRSKKFMNAYLNSQGYYYAELKDSIPKYDTVKNQVRVTVIMNIKVGKNITINSAGYALNDSNMQKLALQNYNKTLLKKGTPFNKQVITDEKDRLTNVFRNNGYYRFSTEDIFAEADTTDSKLLTLTLDPFEQAKLLSEAAKNRKENPKWDILIKQKPIVDSNKLEKFYINKIFYYPETKMTDLPDSLISKNELKQQTRKELTMFYSQGKFMMKPLREHTYLRHDSLYNESLYYKTINSFGQMGSWQQVDSRTILRGKDSLNLHFFLIPAPKQNYSIDLEGSRNTGDIASGNLLGISTSLSYRNRNVFRRAIQSVTSFRVGTEFSLAKNYDSAQSLLQTLQFSLSQTYNFPKLIIPFSKWRYLNTLDNKRTIFSTTASYTDRKEYYVLKSLVTNWGYEWRKGNNIWLFKPLNIELYKVDTLAGLDSLFSKNPFLRNSFQNGNVVGSSLSVIKTFSSKRDPHSSHFIRFSFEESGALISLSKSVSDQVFKYVKGETEYRYVYKFRRSEIATRFFAGVGIPKAGQSIPVFKQYFLGGPNSMRAWGLRQLGLGSSIASDTLKSTDYKDRFGDFVLEGNIEYRFTLWDFSSVKIASALYADMGNVWALKNDPINPNSEFSTARFGKDLAIGIGSGLRLDANYFLIRLDFAYKVKDPARQTNGGWMDFNHIQLTEKRSNGVEVNNLTFQFGIGLPF